MGSYLVFLSYFVWTQIKPDIVPALIFDTLMIFKKKKKNSVQSYLNHVYTCRLMHLLNLTLIVRR